MTTSSTQPLYAAINKLKILALGSNCMHVNYSTHLCVHEPRLLTTLFWQLYSFVSTFPDDCDCVVSCWCCFHSGVIARYLANEGTP